MNQYPLHTVLAFRPKQGFIFLIITDQGCHGSELSRLATMVISFLSIITAGMSPYACVPDFDYVLTDNSGLNTTLTEFETAIVTYSTIESDGFGKFIWCALLVMKLYAAL
jgi:hypothetical protein